MKDSTLNLTILFAVMAAMGQDGYCSMQELITITSMVSAYYDST
jgi:hypothetical protein